MWAASWTLKPIRFDSNGKLTINLIEPEPLGKLDRIWGHLVRHLVRHWVAAAHGVGKRMAFSSPQEFLSELGLSDYEAKLLPSAS